MGQSTDAKLFYGYCWDVENNRRPWTINSGDREEDDEEWEERYAKAMGAQAPTEEYPDLGRDKNGYHIEPTSPEHLAIVAKYQAFWARKRELTKECSCEVGAHCSGDSPMPYVAIASSHVRAARGDFVEVKSLEVDLAWKDQLENFCKLMGIPIPPEGPKWWLVSYWN